MFHQAKQSRAFQNVIDQIQEAILQGKLKAGDRLPGERELKEAFKTSRGTLREALRVLEQKGLITIKTGVGGGPIVKAVTTRQVTESLALLLRYQKVSLRDLAEFREGVEGIVTGLAAERAEQRDIEHLRDLLAKAKAHLEGGVSEWDEFIQVDNALHLELARIARNPVYESVLQTVHENINQYYERYLPKSEKNMKENYQDLCEIVKAVEERQATKARLLAQEHVKRFNRFMESESRPS
ncbi:MAG: FadR family transcriptional regulator [Deltaproteobacteria bacterium]|nr:FadR family transcriptional regulator [Deltaproteobacteria bacterium]MBW2120855.1 FadR family transcriptional regulator [Deltaproteobacteria bacterium]